jgi:peptidoglycan/xylan/chitin deacetylase (PgdA/CDA1 family)
MNGKFVVSLDFELMWGVFEKKTINNYGKNILAVRNVIPKLLELFDKYGIKGTFATVGFLFAKEKNELYKFIPDLKPNYTNSCFSPYNNYINSIGKNEEEDKFHFAYSLIELINKTSPHEIGTHTFCHYYCLEEGGSLKAFKADLQAAIAIASSKGIKITSIVFPRNQFNKDYLQVCYQLGVIAYRGNAKYWIYKEKREIEETSFRRALRLIDAYINISGYNCYSQAGLSSNFPINIPASRLLRPYSPKLRHLEKLRLKRILNEMTFAAKNNLIYHLWWHPHNFGSYTKQNFIFLEKILEHYSQLKKLYFFQSSTMSALANELKNERS